MQMLLHLEAYFRQMSDLDLYQDDRRPDIYTFKFQSGKFFCIFAFPSALCPTASILNKVPWDTSHLRSK